MVQTELEHWLFNCLFVIPASLHMHSSLCPWTHRAVSQTRQQCNSATSGEVTNGRRDSDDFIAHTSLIIKFPMKSGLSVLVKWVFYAWKSLMT